MAAAGRAGQRDLNSVELVPARSDEWATRFEALRALLSAIAPEASIEHIGSTAVAGMDAKDVVDILLGVDAGRMDESVRSLAAAGFALDGRRGEHVWLSAPPHGPRTAVIHVVVFGGEQWHERLAFRDLLRRDATSRSIYLAVKRGAAQRAIDWSDYTARKGACVHWLLNRRPGRLTSECAVHASDDPGPRAEPSVRGSEPR